MNTNEYLLHWLVESAAFGFIIFAIGAAAASWRRSPVERLRLIEWTFVACAAMALVRAVPGVPSWSLGMWGTRAVSVAQVDAPRESEVARVSNEVSPVAGTSENVVRASERPAEVRSNEFVQPEPVATNQVDNSPPSDQRAEALPFEAQSANAPAPLAASAVKETSAEINWAQLLIVGYFFVATLLAARTLFGFVRLHQIDRAAKPVPAEVSNLFDSIVGQASAAKKFGVRLRMSSQVELPLAYGVWRPTILLPERMCAELQQNSSQQGLLPNGSSTAAELRYALAHEWSHLERGDVLRWRLAAALGILFFYQPAYWWLRKQMRLCQDFLADSRAAEQSPVREDYAQFLVRLAQRQLGLPVGMALGIGDKRSSLFRRVKMVLDSDRPLAQRLRWRRDLAIACMALLLAAIASAVRLTAEETPQENLLIAQNQPAAAAESAAGESAKPKVGDAKADGAETLTCSGEVNDALVGKPIAGAKITISKFDKPEYEGGVVLQQIESTSGVDGKYTFELPADRPWNYVTQSQARGFNREREPQSRQVIPIAIEVKHTDYAPHNRSQMVYLEDITDADPEAVFTQPNGFAKPMPQEDAKHKLLGAMDLRPGKDVFGVVQSPDGKPVAGVKVFAHSMVPRNEREVQLRSSVVRTRGAEAVRSSRIPASMEETETDPNGRFRVTMISPGEGAIWITPAKEFTPLVNVLYDRRGDLGAIKLSRGPEIKGRVLDAEGKPLSGVYVGAAPWIEEPQNYSGGLIEHIHRSAETDAMGNFTLGPLPTGEFRLEAQEYFDEHPARYFRDGIRRRPLPALFAPKKFAVEAGRTPEEIELRAVPTVTIDGRFLGDSTTRPESYSSRPTVEGEFKGLPYSTTIFPSEQSNFSISVPRGLTNAIVKLRPESGRLPRWRILSRDAEWRTEPTIELGTLDNDVRDLQIDYSTRTPQFGNDGPGGGGRSKGGIRTSRTPANAKSEAKPKEVPKEITVRGKVQDAETHKPIEGTTVTAWFNPPGSVRDGAPFEKVGEFKSNAQGEFSFPISTAKAGTISSSDGDLPFLALTMQLRHPNYETLVPDHFKTSVVVTPRNVAAAADNIRTIQAIDLQRGEPVTARLVLPDGKPAAGVKILSHTNQDDLFTDADGKFEMNFKTPGDAHYWIYPHSGAVPTLYELHEKRGDLGTIKLEAGPILRGRVLDADGKPLAGVFVRARTCDGNGKLVTNTSRVIRKAETDANGAFTFAPLAPGFYRVEPDTDGGDLTNERLLGPPAKARPLPATFAPQKVELIANVESKPVEFRPTPMVTIEGQASFSRTNGSVDNANRYAQYAPTIIGDINGLSLRVDVKIDETGKFTASVPRGIENVQVKLPERFRSGPQFRTGKDKPLVDPLAFPLGTVREDVRGLEIVYPEEQR